MTRIKSCTAIVALVFAAGLAQAARPPVSKGYPFQLPPEKAVAAVEKLDKVSGQKVTLADDERGLFEDARDEKLDKWSFAEACLIASGVTDPARRKGYLAELDRIEADARKAVEGAKTPTETGDRLLKFLHDGPMKGGYVSKQTDLHTILDDGTFNCVSSAVLFNVIGRRLGLDLAAVEVPEHVFSVLRDGGRRIDVETTSPQGFNPKGQKTPKGTPPADRYAGKRREVGELGLASVVAYNHGVGLADDKRHHEAALANFRALSLDPANPGAANNALAAFVKWGLDLSEDGKYEEALAVVAAGLEVAPKDSALRNNHKVFWHHYAEDRMKAGKDDEALAVLRRAAKAIPSENFEARQADLYIRPAQELIDAGEWDKALDTYTSGLGKVDPKAKARLKDARVGLFLNWANSHADKGAFEKALEVLSTGESVEPKNSTIRNNTVATYDAWANTFMEKKDWAGAINVYEKGLKSLPGDSHLKQNLAYCQQEQAKK
jgi:tetratricopeptide (TPR) repeat protein